MILIVSAFFVVAFSSNLAVVVKIISVVSGSTITGVTEATLYFLSCVTKSFLVCVVKVETNALIAIFTVL